jgi:hypothetical protein
MHAPPDWPQAAETHQYAPHSAEPSLDASGLRADQPPYGQQTAPDAAGYADDEDYEVEEAGGNRFMKIAAALVGAIVVGGGLAFAYTQLMTTDSSKPPLIKSAAGPTKVKAADPGGKKFANADSKLMGRLNEGTSGDSDAAGVKKVSTVKVGADGSIIPPVEVPAESSPAAPEAPTATAPPAVADDAFPSTGATLTAAPAAAPPAAPITVVPPKAPDTSLTVADAGAKAAQSVVSNTTTNSIAGAAAVKPPVPPAAKKVVAAAAPAVAAVTAPASVSASTPAPAAKKPTTTAALAAPSATGSAGFVAVLASVPVSNTSRINALKQFADMQQKYGTVLQNKAPEVKEANLGDKGNFHRLLVGPPGSREGAMALCGSLKQAGYAQSCWVTAY